MMKKNYFIMKRDSTVRKRNGLMRKGDLIMILRRRIHFRIIILEIKRWSKKFKYKLWMLMTNYKSYLQYFLSKCLSLLKSSQHFSLYY